jgi:hypothetical protein
MQLTDLVNDLILADAGGDGSPLPAEARVMLETLLTQTVIAPDRLNDFIRYLQKQLGSRFRYREPLDETTSEAVLSGGLAVLDAAALARLALNPVALAALADEIEECQPAGWTDALRADGLELLRAVGRTIPPLDDLLGRKKQPAARMAATATIPQHHLEVPPMSTDYTSAKRTLGLLDELEALGFDDADFRILHFKRERIKKHREYCAKRVQADGLFHNDHDPRTQQRLEIVLKAFKADPSQSFQTLADRAVDQVDFLPHGGTDGPNPKYQGPRRG